jgi:hypothetical protein
VDGTYESALTRDDLLDNMTLYWLTNIAAAGSTAGAGSR